MTSTYIAGEMTPIRPSALVRLFFVVPVAAVESKITDYLHA